MRQNNDDVVLVLVYFLISVVLEAFMIFLIKPELFSSHSAT